MDINNFPLEFVDDIIKASLTGDIEFIDNWIWKLNNQNYYTIRTAIESLIRKKYNSITYMIKIFNISTKEKYKDRINIYNSKYENINDYLDSIKEEICEINKKILDNKATINDIEFCSILKMILSSCEDDDKIIKDISDLFQYYSMKHLE